MRSLFRLLAERRGGERVDRQTMAEAKGLLVFMAEPRSKGSKASDLADWRYSYAWSRVSGGALASQVRKREVLGQRNREGRVEISLGKKSIFYCNKNPSWLTELLNPIFLFSA